MAGILTRILGMDKVAQSGPDGSGDSLQPHTLGKLEEAPAEPAQNQPMTPDQVASARADFYAKFRNIMLLDPRVAPGAMRAFLDQNRAKLNEVMPEGPSEFINKITEEAGRSKGMFDWITGGDADKQPLPQQQRQNAQQNLASWNNYMARQQAGNTADQRRAYYENRRAQTAQLEARNRAVDATRGGIAARGGMPGAFEDASMPGTPLNTGSGSVAQQTRAAADLGWSDAQKRLGFSGVNPSTAYGLMAQAKQERDVAWRALQANRDPSQTEALKKAYTDASLKAKDAGSAFMRSQAQAQNTSASEAAAAARKAGQGQPLATEQSPEALYAAKEKAMLGAVNGAQGATSPGDLRRLAGGRDSQAVQQMGIDMYKSGDPSKIKAFEGWADANGYSSLLKQLRPQWNPAVRSATQGQWLAGENEKNKSFPKAVGDALGQAGGAIAGGLNTWAQHQKQQAEKQQQAKLRKPQPLQGSNKV